MIRFSGLLFLLLTLFLFACAPARSTYSDKAQLLPDSAQSKKLPDLLKLLPTKNGADADALILTWLQWLDDQTPPLRDEQVFTFVFYDFAGTATKVELEANFMDGRSEALTKAPGTRFYFKVFKLPRPEKLLYNYKVTSPAGEARVPDPMNPRANPGNPPQNKLIDLSLTTGTRHYINAAVNTSLKGQNLIIYLPPFYERNLARSYPVSYIIGLPDGSWDAPVEQKIQAKELQPVILVYMENRTTPLERPNLDSMLLQNIKPWIERHYRTLSDKDNTLLIGWDKAARACAEIQAAHNDIFGKIWVLSQKNDPQFSDQLWSTRGAEALRTFFPEATVQP